MKLHILLIVGLGLGMAGCAEKKKAAPAPVTEAEPPAAAEEMSLETGRFIKHMHYHARKLEEINAALNAGDLDAAGTPAYWLAAHEELEGAADEWQPYTQEMRDAARAVTEAPDIATARAATERIAASCADCHAHAGVDIPTLVLKDE